MLLKLKNISLESPFIHHQEDTGDSKKYFSQLLTAPTSTFPRALDRTIGPKNRSNAHEEGGKVLWLSLLGSYVHTLFFNLMTPSL